MPKATVLMVLICGWYARYQGELPDSCPAPDPNGTQTGSGNTKNAARSTTDQLPNVGAAKTPCGASLPKRNLHPANWPVQRPCCSALKRIPSAAMLSRDVRAG
jgi:hypothetical protein